MLFVCRKHNLLCSPGFNSSKATVQTARWCFLVPPQLPTRRRVFLGVLGRKETLHPYCWRCPLKCLWVPHRGEPLLQHCRRENVWVLCAWVVLCNSDCRGFSPRATQLSLCTAWEDGENGNCSREQAPQTPPASSSSGPNAYE